jgi:hypothetical protein
MGGRDVEVDSSRYTSTKVCIGLCLCFSCYKSDVLGFQRLERGWDESRRRETMTSFSECRTCTSYKLV